MTGYIRNDSANNIANGNVINAADFDGEFDSLQAAFNYVSGHAHDGSSGGGAPIVVVGPAQEILVSASSIYPKATNLIDVGASGLQFKNLWIGGVATLNAVTTGNATITGGSINNTPIGSVTKSSGAFTTIDTTGAATLASVTTSLATISGGTINSTSIGATAPSTGAFTTLTASGGITGTLTGNASTATTLATARTITLSGDVTGSATFNGSANVTIAATIAANAVALGTDTTGNYVSTLAGTANQITVTGSGTETAAVTLSLPTTMVLPGTLQTAGDVLVGGNLVVTGTTTSVNSNTVNLGNSILILNAEETGAPSTDAGIEIERGTSPNVSWLWDETNDRWTSGLQSIYSGGGFIGNITGNLTGTASNATTAVTLTGLLSTITELNYVDGVTSAIQTQINSKQATITGAATTVVTSNLTASAAMVTDASGKIAAHATVTSTELGYLDGVTSNLQTQLGAKAPIASPTFTGAVDAGDSVTLGGFTIYDSGTDLIIKYGAATIFKISSTGAVVAEGDITAFGVV